MTKVSCSIQNFEQLMGEHAKAVRQVDQLAEQLKAEFTRIKALQVESHSSSNRILKEALALAFRPEEAFAYYPLLQRLEVVLERHMGEMIIVFTKKAGLQFWLWRSANPAWSVCNKRLVLKFHARETHLRYSSSTNKIVKVKGDVEAAVSDLLTPDAAGPPGLLQSVLRDHGGPETASKSWMGEGAQCQCFTTVPHLLIGENRVAKQLTEWFERGLLTISPWDIEPMTYPPDPVPA